MSEFLFLLALLLQCGIFPMSPDACRPAKSVPAPPPAITQAIEAP